MLSINDDIIEISCVRLELLVFSYTLWSLSFLRFCWWVLLPGRGGNSKFVSGIPSNYSYHFQNWLQWVVSTLRFCITTASELEERWWILLIFLNSWVSFLTFSIVYVVCQSKIFLYLGGHIQIIALYQGHIELWVQLWSWYLSTFQNRVPNAMVISHWEVDPGMCSSLCIQFFLPNRGRDHWDLAMLNCNLLSNWIKCHKIGVDLSKE